MERVDEVYVQHILDAIRAVAEYTEGKTYAAFTEDRMLQDAVVREIEIIGEAANHLSDAFRSHHTSIPWSDVVGMRNKLIHEYFGVDPEVVWKTAREDLPHLRSSLMGPV